MLNPVSALRHATVGAAALAAPLLVATGTIGGGVHDERFDAKQVVVAPAGDGVLIREVVDQDFGDQQHHGYERRIPNDFGVPTSVTASSPDAPDRVSVTPRGFETRIRIGDPDTTIDGQHRYVLTYVLPEAQLSTGELALDIIGTDEAFETGRFEVVVAGFELADAQCNVGDVGAVGGCELVADGDVYRAVIEPLAPGQGITIGGRIVRTFEPAAVVAPPLPARRGGVPLPLVGGTALLGAGAASGTYRLARRLGRNRVAGGGAADAAYGTDGTAGADGSSGRLVPDAEMAAMATTEFVPPTGLQPWQGAMLLKERVDRDTVSAWFAGHIAREVLELQPGTPLVLRAGPRLGEADETTRQRLHTMLGGDGEIELGAYRPALADAWTAVTADERAAAKSSGWWARFPPGTEPRYPWPLMLTVLGCAVVVGLAAMAGLLRSMPIALVLAVAVPAVVAMSAYRRLLPVRSAAGSALALRTESFRRFLEASEGRHVDWAWQQGLLREYTAWAVALGAADAWGRALAASAVPPPEMSVLTTPILVHTNGSAFDQARHKPAPTGSGSSGGGFSGGFSGGSVGGGGGGGSSGSW